MYKYTQSMIAGEYKGMETMWLE